jgi:glycosyltransferase involved in cell wall biosynthesis
MSLAARRGAQIKGKIGEVIRPWRLPLKDLRYQALGMHTIPRVRRFEIARVTGFAAQLPPPPPALVATIMVTYKRPEMLRKAVQSALEQTVSDQVIVVIDDGGGLPDLPADPRLRAYSMPANSGTPHLLRNIAIQLTRSQFVAFLDDDNEWEPQHLEVALAALTADPPASRPDMVYTALRRSFPDGRLLDILSVPFDRRRLASGGIVDTNAIVARRCRHLHFHRLASGELKPPCDWELVWRMSRRHRITHVPVPTVRYLVNPDSYFSDWHGGGVMATVPGDDARRSAPSR